MQPSLNARSHDEGRLSQQGHLMRRTTGLMSSFEAIKERLIVEKKCGKVNYISPLHSCAATVASGSKRTICLTENCSRVYHHGCPYLPPKRARAHRAPLNNFRTKQRSITADLKTNIRWLFKTPLTSHQFCKQLCVSKNESEVFWQICRRRRVPVVRTKPPGRSRGGERQGRGEAERKGRGADIKATQQGNYAAHGRTDAFIFRF